MEEQIPKYVSQKDRISLAIKQKMAWAILAISAIAFAFKEALDFQRTGVDLLTFVMTIGITYMFTIYVSFAMRRMGKKSGKENPLYISTMQNLKDAKDSIKDIVFMTPVFCRIKNIQALKEVRRNILEENGLKYVLWEKGYYKTEEGIDKLDLEQTKALEDIKNITISTLTSNQLLSEHASKKVRRDPLYMGKDESVDAFHALISIAVSKMFVPIVFSYFTVNVALGTNILWGIIQTSIILLIGLMYYMDGEEFVLSELRNRYINKADLLFEFRSLYDNRHNLFEAEEKEFEQIEEKIAKPDKEIQSDLQEKNKEKQNSLQENEPVE